MKVFYVTLYLLFVLSLTAKAQDSVKVALVQAHLAWGDVDANLRDFDKRVRSCKGCDMIVFLLSVSDQTDEEMGETFGGVGCRFYDL